MISRAYFRVTPAGFSDIHEDIAPLLLSGRYSRRWVSDERWWEHAHMLLFARHVAVAHLAITYGKGVSARHEEGDVAVMI